MAQAYFHSSGALSLAATASPHPWLAKITSAWHRLLQDVFDPYRPERHYMRGPGPKWRAKHHRRAATAP